MAETTVFVDRPDSDIRADIERVLVRYPPMVNDRHHVNLTVADGLVTLSGYTRTGITRRYLMETLSRVAGVRGMVAAELYDDESLRLAVGSAIPVGIFTTVEYGHIILSGRLPAGQDADALVSAVSAVPGVRGVHTHFIG